MPEPARSPFHYAILRVVPRVERGERFNVGVVLFCRQRDFLGVRVDLDEQRLTALAPGLAAAEMRPHLDALVAGGAGRPGGGADRGDAGLGALRLAGRPVEHDDPALGGPHRTVGGPGRDARRAVRRAGRAGDERIGVVSQVPPVG